MIETIIDNHFLSISFNDCDQVSIPILIFAFLLKSILVSFHQDKWKDWEYHWMLILRCCLRKWNRNDNQGQIVQDTVAHLYLTRMSFSGYIRAIDMLSSRICIPIFPKIRNLMKSNDDETTIISISIPYEIKLHLYSAYANKKFAWSTDFIFPYRMNFNWMPSFDIK